jgi:hypothetical protein
MPHFINLGTPFGLFGQLNWWRNTKFTWKAYEETEKELLPLDREPRYITTVLFYQTRVNLLLTPFNFMCLIFIFWLNPCSFTEVLLSLGITAADFLLHPLLAEHVISPGICHLLNQLLLALCPYVVRWKAWVCICSVGGEHKMFGEFNLNDRW